MLMIANTPVGLVMLDTLFLYTAIAGGALFAAQMFYFFLAGDGDLGVDADSSHGDSGHHGDGFWFFEMISLRTIAAAATFFGVVGLTARSFGAEPKVAVLCAGMAGFAAMYSVYWTFRQLFRLESSGTQDIFRAIGLPASVYLRIPANHQGPGKVLVDMQSRTVEYLAVTDDVEPIPSGANVWVVDIVNTETLRVTRRQPESATEITSE